jgi:O-antigen/teichoic acid export membrane protein
MNKFVKKSIKKSVARLKTISWYSASQIIGFLPVFILSFLIIKFHSTQLWGQYAEILIWSNFFLLFLSFGSNDYLLKQFSNSPNTIAKDWTDSIKSRSLFLVISALIIFIFPIFKNLKILLFTLISIQFITQSFRVFILYYRNFKFSIIVDIIALFLLVLLVLYFKENLNIELIIKVVIGMQCIKMISYLFYYYKEIASTFLNKTNLKGLQYSLLFFIPIAIGTIRVKIDAYYGTFFFDDNTLSKYQILLNFLLLAQISSTFIINPFLKNLYRLKDFTIKTLHKRFFIFGWFFALIITLFTYFCIKYLYLLEFTFLQYLFAFLFIVPLFLHLLIINEYYKKNLQKKLIKIASFVVVLQLILGFFILKNWNLDGAIILKAVSQWIIVFLLWLPIKKIKNA